MRKALSLFFVLTLLLAGCSQNNTSANENVSSKQNSTVETNISDNSSDVELEPESSDQPLVVEECIPVLNEFANGNEYEFNLTIRNNSGSSLDSPNLTFDFLNADKDILWSGWSSHDGVVKNGQAFIVGVYLNDSDYAFDFFNDFKYVSITTYGWADYTRTDGATRSDQVISDPYLFPLS